MKTLSDQGFGNMAKQLVVALPMVIVMMSFYTASMLTGPGVITAFISALALVMIVVTSVVRANDIGSKTGIIWNLRRIALVATGAAAAGLLLLEQAPSWKDTLLHVGVALTWFTTPGMPPWWKYIAGIDGDDCKRGKNVQDLD